jgi:hypothetical protein
MLFILLSMFSNTIVEILMDDHNITPIKIYIYF